MRIPRIHTTQPLTPGARIVLEPQASAHLARVLRLRAGAPVTLFDGSGQDYLGELLVAIPRKPVEISILKATPCLTESSLNVHLGLVMSRGERMDYAIQKSTELGVTAITPLFSEHCDVRLPANRTAQKLGHWQRVSISACEQCGRSQLPAINPPLSLGDWVSTVNAEQRILLDLANADNQLQMNSPPASVALLTGPEGGFSDSERCLAQQEGFTSLQLGPRVLRAETAPVAALSLLQCWWGDFPAL